MKSWTHTASLTLKKSRNIPPFHLTTPLPLPPYHLATLLPFPPCCFITLPYLPDLCTSLPSQLSHLGTSLPSHLYHPQTSPLSHGQIKHSKISGPTTVLPIITPYSVEGKSFSESMRGQWHIIENDSQLHNIGPNHSFTTHLKTESLKDILVYSCQARPVYLHQRTTPKQNH